MTELRDCIVLRARLPISPHLEREELVVPRLRRRSCEVCSVAGMGGKGRADLLPGAGRGNARCGEGRDEQQRRCHREHVGLCEEAGDDCVIMCTIMNSRRAGRLCATKCTFDDGLEDWPIRCPVSTGTTIQPAQLLFRHHYIEVNAGDYRCSQVMYSTGCRPANSRVRRAQASLEHFSPRESDSPWVV